MQHCLVNDNGDHLYSEGTTVNVAYDYIKGISIRVPDEWRQRIQAFEGRILE
jgi:acyl-CoA thioesterase FadM